MKKGFWSKKGAPFTTPPCKNSHFFVEISLKLKEGWFLLYAFICWKFNLLSKIRWTMSCIYGYIIMDGWVNVEGEWQQSMPYLIPTLNLKQLEWFPGVQAASSRWLTHNSFEASTQKRPGVCNDASTQYSVISLKSNLEYLSWTKTKVLVWSGKSPPKLVLEVIFVDSLYWQVYFFWWLVPCTEFHSKIYI